MPASPTSVELHLLTPDRDAVAGDTRAIKGKVRQSAIASFAPCTSEPGPLTLVKPAFHDADTDILARIFAGMLACRATRRGSSRGSRCRCRRRGMRASPDTQPRPASLGCHATPPPLRNLSTLGCYSNRPTAPVHMTHHRPHRMKTR